MKIQTFKTIRSQRKILNPLLSRGMRGFTLLEMAIVLAIIGLVMGTIMAMTKTLSSSSKIAATQSKEALIKAALINFIATNNRLPCPADPTGALASPGTEVINTATTPKSCSTNTSVTASPATITASSNSVYAGVVPWVTLGLTQDSATDGYNHYFTYLVAATAIWTVPAASVGNGVPSISGLKGAISIYASQASLTTPTNNCIPTGSTSTYNPCSAVVALISHGDDGFGAYTNNGAASAFSYADENQNALHTNQIVMHDFSMNATNPFDDIILPLTTSDLLSSLSANGTIQPYNAVLNNEFANITAATTAYAINHKYGSAGSVNYVLPPTGSPALAIYDPWGNQIQYSAVTSPINNATSAVSQAFTLQSYGPDGISSLPGTSDDIFASITVSQLQGAFGAVGW